MNTKLSSLVRIVTAFLLVSASRAEPNKVLYELQERCGKQAAENFQKQYGGTVVNGGQTIALFENHYNARLNKCIYLLSVRGIRDDKKRTRGLVLNDLYDNKLIGTYLSIDDEVMFCDVRDAKCRRRTSGLR